MLAILAHQFHLLTSQDSRTFSCRLFSALFTRFRKKLKVVVDSNAFQRGILLAILVNTLSMGIEYHNQVRAIYECLFSVIIVSVKTACTHSGQSSELQMKELHFGGIKTSDYRLLGRHTELRLLSQWRRNNRSAKYAHLLCFLSSSWFIETRSILLFLILIAH